MRDHIIRFVLLLGILIFVNVLGQYFFGQIDLTEEKRFTLTQPTKEHLKKIDDVVFVKVLLEGEFPAGFKRLQRATKEMLDDFRAYSGFIEYQFEDPSAGTAEEANKRKEDFAKDGIFPFSLFIVENGEKTQKLAYPYAIVTYRGRTERVKLLESQSPGENQEVALNNSVSLLEYKLASAIRNLMGQDRLNTGFTTGHGELQSFEMADMLKSLQQVYNTVPVNFDSTYTINPAIFPAILIAKPRTTFSQRDKFIIDQYVMNGGKIVWMLDRLAADNDSLRRPGYVTYDYPLDLEDMLFKYGVRLKPDIVLDLECGDIALQTGRTDESKPMESFPWPYYPVVSPAGNHPIVQPIDRVWLRFPNTIDTVQTKTPIRKTPLLASSKYSRQQFSPVPLSLEIIRHKPDPAQYNVPNIPLAVLLEGEFPSAFENRVSAEMQQALDEIKTPYRAKSKPTSMVVISDGDVIHNDLNLREQTHYPLGYSRDANFTFDNKNFLFNTIEYLLGENGNFLARNKTVTLRLLDVNTADSQKSVWQTINIAGPMLLLAFGAWIFTAIRRRRYAS